jgi:hypothetical protein
MSDFIDQLASFLSLGDQSATVDNFGTSTANTGHNDVIGNNSTNTALSFQSAQAGGGLFGPGDDATAVNSASNLNASDGTAVVVTGSASAVGNVADTNIAQVGGGSLFGGIGIGDQDAHVTNYGDASADTGHNTVIGNNSTNTALSFQDSHASGGLFGPGDDATAVNSAQNANISDGTAVLVTGNAQAVGNVADTNIAQVGGHDSFGSGIGIGDQHADVTNIGHANADTGHNTVIGNNSTNTAVSFQDAHAGGGLFGPGDDATAVNSSHNTNVSDGHAALQTGDAHAVGNVGHTDIAQDQHHGDLGHFDFHM